MSHPDPYGSEPRGWDRAERPVALPWPEQDLEAGQWSRRPTAGPELYADPHTRPYADPNPYDERGRTVRPDDRDRFDDRDPREDDEPGRYDGPQPFDGPVRYDDDAGYPTAQLAPIGAEIAPDPEPVIEPEPPSGRRTKGRRRASVDRPATQQLGTGRAGRNLPAAIGVGLGLGALIVVPLVVYPLAFLLVLAGAVAVGMWEMARAVRRSGAHPPLVPLIAGGVLTVGLAWFAGPDALSLGLLVTVLGTMIWRLGDGPAGFQRDLTAATLIAVYVPFLAGFAALLAAAPDDGPLRILATLIAVVLSDTGGYAAGVSFGRHPMAPSISPKKSWEGFAGSVTAAALGSALLLWLMFEVAPWWGAVFGVAVSCAAVLGDLAESMIKRDLGVKDMSNLLPGHGGLMDRLDSILFAVPTAYLLLAVFVPVVN
ncbi:MULTISPECIES: phosphatidate cytidylyltransferase [unclassified Micromonospora]|uniref:phosphatidate cytidylyltransferase n=1 Tax=unclassified Micromonospora TaxID=2617518 RepID=UPI00115090DC|nr:MULTISPECIES: phosphatidate cytidylyltransferase [unclassified Micromonospora]MBQ1036545.1 phosphatidate cytidylyltransferase [Micromonospora sp. C81]TQJ20908.1 phosphatidate cytidylyltransferase [Micromonospora sp. A202]